MGCIVRNLTRTLRKKHICNVRNVTIANPTVYRVLLHAPNRQLVRQIAVLSSYDVTNNLPYSIVPSIFDMFPLASIFVLFHFPQVSPLIAISLYSVFCSRTFSGTSSGGEMSILREKIKMERKHYY
ncbi:hypothetical protein L873DRAFT_106171 [Choiromyces venosus 120613-1]|uniref:Uncharacterized protein n=1 Tax=Choiromyces venosus 120613-1 TaxID=1336337 RepID=A0A3N4K3G1_9PEZI|nr:hypothetical protein L873DRAFT_106171 [Choiromyces venosus 120613-1]